MSSPRQRVINTFEFNHPDKIPVVYNPSTAGLYKHGKKLLDLFNAYPPDNPVECGAAIEIRYECRGFPIVPGCSVSFGLEFSWHDRAIAGSSIYISGSSHGLMKINARQRGEYHANGSFFTITDAAGFFHFKAASVLEHKLTVKSLSVDNIKMQDNWNFSFLC